MMDEPLAQSRDLCGTLLASHASLSLSGLVLRGVTLQRKKHKGGDSVGVVMGGDSVAVNQGSDSVGVEMGGDSVSMGQGAARRGGCILM